MKHLKLFEDRSNKIKVTTVYFVGDDAVHACYVDDDLEFYGDYYHDKIRDKIKGFVLGLKWVKENYVYPLIVEEDNIKCTDAEMIESVCEYGEMPPKKLSDVIS